MYIKGFDENLCCRGYQFEVGKDYKIDIPEDVEMELFSDTVFHFANNMVWIHTSTEYKLDHDSRYCEIEVLGDMVSDNYVCASNHIRIIRELTKEEIDILFGRVNGNTGIFNTGENNYGNYNTGDYNFNNYNSGDLNSGKLNSGDINSGNYNSGNYNSGYHNTGDNNKGNRNSGVNNSGNCNTNHFNSGDYNSGMFNSCDYSSGDFCSISPTVRVFNVDTGMTREEYIKTDFYRILKHSVYKASLTRWNEQTEELEEYGYKEACTLWWDKLSDEEKAIITGFEYFNAEVFYDITGIDLR